MSLTAVYRGGSGKWKFNLEGFDRLPKDAWNRDYQYVSPGSHGDFDVYSLGQDGQTGGEGLAADIGNWTE